MRKNALAMSVATLVGSLGFVGAASADVVTGTQAVSASWIGDTNATELRLTTGGIGHQLITPYFNAQNGNATIISLVNTDTTNGKVVKVRFRGASNSDDILDFTVLMSPGDVWNATVTSPSATAPAQIVTSDRSCTLPQLSPGVAQPFVTARLTTKGGNDLNNNTREGYVEIFNMANIRPGSALFNTVKHTAGVPACTQSTINSAILDQNITGENEAAFFGLAAPTTGLFGNWTIINVPQTTTYSGAMTAIRATDAGGNDAIARLVVFPQSAGAYPQATINQVTADPLLRTDAFATKTNMGVGGGALTASSVAAAFYDLPDMSTPYVNDTAINSSSPLSQAYILTNALAVNNTINEYATDAIISAKTDWVFSMPTRRYSVAMDYSQTTSRRLFSVLNYAGFQQHFHTDNTRVNPSNSQQICVDASGQTFYDREETTKTSGAVFSPGNVAVTTFCGEVSVLSFADSGSSVLGASVARQDTGSSAFTNGWGRVNYGAPGLPILGDAFIKATNPQVATGQSGTYGITTPHRTAR